MGNKYNFIVICLLLVASEEGTSEVIKVELYGQLKHGSHGVQFVVLLSRAIRLQAVVRGVIRIIFWVVDFLKLKVIFIFTFWLIGLFYPC